MIDSLHTEVEIMKQLSSAQNSANVVKLLDYIPTKATTYIIIEFCEEGDLAHFINAHGGLLEEKVAIDVL